MLNHYLHHSLNTKPELGEHPKSPNLSLVCVSIFLDTTRVTQLCVGSTVPNIFSWILEIQTQVLCLWG